MMMDVRQVSQEETKATLLLVLKNPKNIDIKLDDEDREWFFTWSSNGYKVSGHGRHVSNLISSKFDPDGKKNWYFWVSVTGGALPYNMRWDLTLDDQELYMLIVNDIIGTKLGTKISDFIQLPSSDVPLSPEPRASKLSRILKIIFE